MPYRGSRLIRPKRVIPKVTQKYQGSSGNANRGRTYTSPTKVTTTSGNTNQKLPGDPSLEDRKEQTYPSLPTPYNPTPTFYTKYGVAPTAGPLQIPTPPADWWNRYSNPPGVNQWPYPNDPLYSNPELALAGRNLLYYGGRAMGLNVQQPSYLGNKAYLRDVSTKGKYQMPTARETGYYNSWRNSQKSEAMEPGMIPELTLTSQMRRVWKEMGYEVGDTLPAPTPPPGDDGEDSGGGGGGSGWSDWGDWGGGGGGGSYSYSSQGFNQYNPGYAKQGTSAPQSLGMRTAPQAYANNQYATQNGARRWLQLLTNWRI